MNEKRIGLVIGILLLAILLLGGFVIYAFAIKPVINNYVVQNQLAGYNKGVEDVIVFMVNDIQQKGYTQITVENQSIFLTPFNPQQVQQ